MYVYLFKAIFCRFFICESDTTLTARVHSAKMSSILAHADHAAPTSITITDKSLFGHC
jgi:hypothetical protein